MRRIFITGANRGVGLELVSGYLRHEDTLIFASYRSAASATALNTLAEAHPQRVIPLPLDVSDQASIDASVRRLRAEIDGLDMLINNAGILPGGVDAPDPASAAFGSLDAAAMLQVFQVNSVAPVMIAQAYASLLRNGTNPLLVNVSSDAGSLARRNSGCNYSYPASKAALNMMTRCLAGDFRADNVIVVSVHPGWIRTDMGGASATLAPADTVPALIRVLDRLTISDSGKFLNWDGSPVPW